MMVDLVNPVNFLFKRQIDGTSSLKDAFFKQRLDAGINLYSNNLFGHVDTINAIEFSSDGGLLVSGGDDKSILLWNLNRAISGLSPFRLQTSHNYQVQCLAFNADSSRIFSSGYYSNLIVHDMKSGVLVDKVIHSNRINGLSSHPQQESLFCAAREDGKILLYDMRDTSAPFYLAKTCRPFYSAKFNPVDSNQLVAAHEESGPGIWDIRQPGGELLQFNKSLRKKKCIYAVFNSTGTFLISLCRYSPPTIYSTSDPTVRFQFYHPDCCSFTRFQTTCFVGDDDEYFLNGSDANKHMYMWKVPKANQSKCVKRPHLVQHNNETKIKHIQYNKHNKLIASIGNDMAIKVWSSLPF